MFKYIATGATLAVLFGAYRYIKATVPVIDPSPMATKNTAIETLHIKVRTGEPVTVSYGELGVLDATVIAESEKAFLFAYPIDSDDQAKLWIDKKVIKEVCDVKQS